MLSTALNATAFIVEFGATPGAGAGQPERPAITALATRIISGPPESTADAQHQPIADSAAAGPGVPPAAVSPPALPPALTPVPPPAVATLPSVSVAALPIPATSATSAPTYWKTSDLDASPRPMEDITPDYPEHSATTRGHVILELFIDEQGLVERVDIISATPPGLFDDAARSAFLRAKFEPGRRLGVPTRFRMTIELDFNPGDRGGGLSTKGY